MRYSNRVRELLAVAKKFVALSNPEAVKEKEQVIGWLHLTTAACSTSLLDVHLAKLLKLSKLELLWPEGTKEAASKVASQPDVEIPLRPTRELDELFSKIKGGDTSAVLELEDIARAVWDGAPQEWRGALCILNGLPESHRLSGSETDHRSRAEADVPNSELGRLWDRIARFSAELKSTVIGQQHAIEEIAHALLHSGLVRSRGPKATMVFVGPPGCGKTHTALALGEQVFAGKYRRFDMSAYSDPQSGVEGLIGIPSFYSGSKERPGELTNYVRRNPSSLLIFDEIEKAAPAVIRLFLQVLDSGALDDKCSAEKVSFSDATIIFTTNAGRSLYEDPNRTGLICDSPKMYRDTILDALEKEKNQSGHPLFPAEICSRLAGGHPVLFRALEPLDYERIIDLEWPAFSRGVLGQCGVSIACDDPVVKALLVLHSGPDLDARRVRHTAARIVTESVLAALRSSYQPETMRALLTNAVDRLELRMSPSEGGEITQFIKEGARRVLLVDDRQEFLSLFESSFPDYEWYGATNASAACDVIRTHRIDWVLQDLDLRGASNEQMDVESGIQCLAVLHKQWPSLPVYILSKALQSDRFDQDLYNRCVGAGGARGYINKTYTDSSQTEDAKIFKAQIEEIRSNLAREAVVRRMLRSRKRVVFDIAPRLHGASRSVHCNIHNVRFETVPTSTAYTQFQIVKPNTRLQDVAGNEGAMKELRLIIEWLRDPGRFGRLGAPIPRGVLMVGPPGTGKTLLARAVAGEADVPFVPVKGSEFTTAWQASGASSIRELFASARKHAPCIVFIDEIDAVAGQRGQMADSNGERRQALTQLLTEMDGFSRSSDSPPVVVLAATNRAEDLDDALKRPGRFDRLVEVELPNQSARERILRVHARNKGVGEIDWRRVAQRTAGYSGAELEQVVYGALTLATLAGKDLATEEDLNEAITRHRLGSAEEGLEKTELDRTVVAAHEAGHAVALKALFPRRPIPQVTIVGRRSVGGFVERGHDESESQLPDRITTLAEITVLMAGRAAEQVLCSTATAGASSDLTKATSIALDMVTLWGLGSDTGLLSTRGMPNITSEHRKAAVENAIQAILSDCMDRAKRLIEENRKITSELQALLQQKETLLDAEIIGFWTKYGLPKEPN